MNGNGSKLIDSLVEDLGPVRPLKWRTGVGAALLALAATIVIVVLWAGFRDGLMSGQVGPLYLLANGLFLLLGIAAASAVVAMSNPQVGARHEGPTWGMAAVALLPLAAIISAFGHGVHAGPLFHGRIDYHCVLYSLLATVLVASALLLWLRRGAPVSIEKAGFLAGISAGALGAFAYGLACPQETMNHLGIWHVLPIAVSGLAGRVVFPPLLRW